VPASPASIRNITSIVSKIEFAQISVPVVASHLVIGPVEPCQDR